MDMIWPVNSKLPWNPDLIDGNILSWCVLVSRCNSATSPPAPPDPLPHEPITLNVFLQNQSGSLNVVWYSFLTYIFMKYIILNVPLITKKNVPCVPLSLIMILDSILKVNRFSKQNKF